MNIITFDIEEWAVAKAGGYGSLEKYAEYNNYLNRILEVLDEKDIKATFFCTGLMAQDFPQVVKLIRNRGHEIGCHSHLHSWMNKMTEKEAQNDTHKAVDSLEQCIGEKVLSYRAPAFSIGEENKWMFEVLVKEGITRDASVFPASRALGGFPLFGCQEPCIVEYAGVSIKEYPVGLTSVMGKKIAYSGGGYFRFFPMNFVKSRMNNSNYCMCYFHIGDLLPETKGVYSRKDYETYFKEPGTLKNRYTRFFKANFGKKNAWNKLDILIRENDFEGLGEAEKAIDWNFVPLIKF